MDTQTATNEQTTIKLADVTEPTMTPAGCALPVARALPPAVMNDVTDAKS